MKQIFLFIIGIILVTSCNNRNATQEEYEIETPDSIANTPECIIYLQPYNTFSMKDTEKLVPELRTKFDSLLYGYWLFVVLEPINLPKDSYIKSINRYKATKILDEESRKRKKETVIIGLTHEDICTDIHKKKNYGIIGLSYSSKRVCIISDKRLHNKKDTWKPIMHEFIHAFYGSSHCAEDNDFCIMQDGKGKGDFSNKNTLCASCKH